jgi:enoyl-CoA hydratase
MTPPAEPPVDAGTWERLRFERDGDVLVVTIDHPDSAVNAVDALLHHELAALVRGLRRERSARAVLLTGAGRAFCAGGDLDWFPELRSPEVLDELRRDARSIVWDLLDVELPIVCALNGHAMGLGASVALLCDLVVAADDALIGDPHVRVGLVAGDGGTVIWPMVLGPARAKEHLLLGDPLDAVAAEQLGLVNRVVPRGEVFDVAMGLARRLAEGAPLAVRATKLAVNQQLRAALLASFDTATALELATFHSEDHAEAVRAARERRPPRFRGR